MRRYHKSEIQLVNINKKMNNAKSLTLFRLDRGGLVYTQSKPKSWEPQTFLTQNFAHS